MAFLFKQGKYTGNGSTTQGITGIGFQPKVVFIFADNYSGWQSAIWKSDTMATGNSTGANANWGENGLETSGKISSLDADGFTVAGTDSTTRNAINKSSQTYYYVAIGGSDVVTGSFSGNGSDNRGITGVGFQAEVVVVQCGHNHVRFKTKASGVSTDLSSFSSGPTLSAAANGIQSIDSDGFTVGSDNTVNQSGQTVHWFAVKTVTGVKSGQFTGNGSDNRNITGAGFQPEFVMIKQESGGSSRPGDEAAIQTAQHSTDAGDSTMASRTDDSYADGIQALQADGFQVGGHGAVNKNSATINWFAFAPVTAVSAYRGMFNLLQEA